MTLTVNAWTIVMLTTVLISDVQAISCPTVDVQYGQVTYTDQYRGDGSSYTLTCLPGYVIAAGQNTLTSGCWNGTWDTSAPAACSAINCGPAPSPSHVAMAYADSSLGHSDYGQEITYLCPSGYYFSNRLDKSDMVKFHCNLVGQWEVTMGLVNNTAKQFECLGYYNYHGCYQINVTIPTNITENIGTSGSNRDHCLGFCHRNDFIFAARQGDMCYCTNTQQYPKTINTNCNRLCQDNTTFCGGDPDLFSVWNTISPCVKIDSAVTSDTRKQMYTADTCQQICYGLDQSLAFWRADVLSCNCFDSIPSYTATAYCYYPKTVIDENIGELYILDFVVSKYNACAEIFDDGIFYSGQYYLFNGTKTSCYFLDNSTTNCGENWVAYNGHCYLFVGDLGDMNYHFYNTCLAHNSHLVTIVDSMEGDFLTRSLTKMAHMKNIPVYIGLYDIQQMFSYMWVDETAFTYRNFAQDYPKNIYDRCVMYDLDSMQNNDCQAHIGAICEISQSSSIGCAVTNTSQLQLKAVNAKMSTPFCFESCRSSGFRYSATRSVSCFCSNNETLFNSISWTQCDTPCPRHKYQLCGGNETGLVFVTQDVNQPYRDSCLTMILGSLLSNVTLRTSNGSLVNTDCLAYAGAVCPESWIAIDGRCYRFFIESIEYPSAMCTFIGGYLAVYETAEEAQSVVSTIQMASVLSSRALWITGLFRHRKQWSPLRFTNGAYVNESTKLGLEQDSSNCYAHKGNDSSKYTGVICNGFSYICEKGLDYRGCTTVLAAQYQRLVGYRDLTVTQCLETCKGSGRKMAGVRYQTACYCFDNENVTKVSDLLCEKICSVQQSCGSLLFEHMTVYAIDYSKNASSCQDLFDQGVLLSGRYSIGRGDITWCGMKDSKYLAQQIEQWSVNGTGDMNFTDLSWHRVGTDNVTLAIDVSNSSRSGLLYQRCTGVLKGSSIVGAVKSREQLQLISDILKWSLDTPVSAPAYIGLMDQFTMGTYTWSDGSLFRLTDINWTVVPDETFTSSNLSNYMLYNVNGTFQSVNTTDSYHAVCQTDKSYQRCLMLTNSLPPNLYAVRGYNSMTLTSCRQICQVNETNQLLLSSKDCVCYNPINNNFDLKAYFTNASDISCDVTCPGNELQKCGGGQDYFRQHSIDGDVAETCEDLYNNFVVLPNYYLINGSKQFCGLDDLSASCPPGFIAKNKKCFRFYRQLNKNAAKLCLAQGATLVSPVTKEDIQELSELIHSISPLRTAELWQVGYVSAFVNGYYVTSLGHMIAYNDVMVAGLQASSIKSPVALNVTSGQLVAVPSTTVLPFICQIQQEVSGCAANISQSDVLSSLTLTSAMSIQQCLAFCQGPSTQGNVWSLLQESQCLCVKASDRINLTQTSCKKSCPGNLMQLCGSAADNSYSVYKLSMYSSTYVRYSCDKLMYYGVVQPASYMVDTSQLMTCFKYSVQSSLLLSNITGVIVTSSNSTMLPTRAILKLLALSFQGWIGTIVPDLFLYFDLTQLHVIEGLILYGNMKTISLLTSLDNMNFEAHPDNVIQINVTSVKLNWVTLTKLVVARWVKIKFLSWASGPLASVEFVGYRYSQHNASYHFRGCHSNLTVNYQAIPSGGSYEGCRSECKESGFPYVIMKSERNDTCYCLSGQNTRDFYSDAGQHCQMSCFDYRICSDTDQYQALYLTTDVGCPVINISSANMSAVTQNMADTVDSLPLMSNVTYVCHTGHEMYDNLSSITSQCFNFEQWIPSLANITCSKKNCGSYPLLQDTELIVTENMTTLYGETVQYSCLHDGYRFNGTVELWNMTCDDSKSWQPSAPNCEAVMCPDKPAVLNATPNDTAPVNMYNSAVTFTCDDGCYFPSDNQTTRTIFCLITGQWTDIEPFCQKLRCSSLPPPLPHATVVLSNDSSVAYYQCVKGTHFTDQTSVKETSCDNVTLLWTDIQDFCLNRDLEEASIWLVMNNTYLSGPAQMETRSRSLVDCSIRCVNLARCSMFNLIKDNSLLNCRLFITGRSHFTWEPQPKWAVYFVNRP